ncbi:MAG: hypothetical protein Kow0089_08360 [Desulfobulbaceae bacterium]
MTLTSQGEFFFFPSDFPAPRANQSLLPAGEKDRMRGILYNRRSR